MPITTTTDSLMALAAIAFVLGMIVALGLTSLNTAITRGSK
jgi:hypothetical protein